MGFFIDPLLSDQLRKLDKYDKQALDKLCEATFDLLKNGAHLESEQDEDTKSIVTDSMTLIVQSLKFGISDSELNELLRGVECHSYYRQQLVQNYQQYKTGLTKVLLAYSTNADKRFVHLRWKLQVKVASKYMREQLLPVAILRFEATDQEGKATCFDMQCSVADIFHMVERLGEALRRNNSQHCIKLLRHIK